MICLMVLALLAGVANAQDEGSKIVSRSAQGYSVDASQTNVVQLLTEMGQHAGFTVEAPDTFNSQITLSVQDAPLDQVLRRVLRNENYIIVYRGGVQKATISSEGIDKIFLLSPATGQATKPVAAGGTSPLAGPAAPGQKAGPLARNAPPPPPPPPLPPGAAGDGDPAVRAARARAQARALGDTSAAGPGGAPGAPGAMPGAARMVQNPDEVTPPSADGPEAQARGAVPGVDVPPGAEERDEGEE